MNWIFFVSRRFAKVDRSGRSAVTGFLASLSICFGVMTLIVTVSVMNGFQMGFIDSIMEISSAHIRVTAPQDFDQQAFEQQCFRPELGVVAMEPMYEAQSLLASATGRQAASLIRAVSPDIMYTDAGFAQEMQMISGEFDLSRPGYIVLGSQLARQLGLRVGSTVNMLALSGGSDVDLISDNRVFVVSGIFSCGYAEINNSYSFISLDAGQQFFGKDATKLFALKLADSEKDMQVIYQLEKALDLIAAADFSHWNCDLIYAVPGQDCRNWASEFDALERYPIDHVSCYNLTQEEGALLSDKLVPDMETAAELEKITLERLAERGIFQYEVSNYARPGGECQHNVNVWRGGLLRGFGPSAAGFDGTDRQSEVPSVEDWLAGAFPEVDRISVPERLNEIFAVNLRTVAGWKSQDWLAVPHHDSWQERLSLAGDVEKIYPGCFEITADSVKLTRKGLSFWDTIAEELLS